MFGGQAKILTRTCITNNRCFLDQIRLDILKLGTSWKSDDYKKEYDVTSEVAQKQEPGSGCFNKSRISGLALGKKP
jgi:hypothetical protein